MKQYYIWPGFGCRMIGEKVADLFGKSEMLRLDGGVCTVDTAKLTHATEEQVNWALWLGGTTIPPTGEPPSRIPGNYK